MSVKPARIKCRICGATYANNVPSARCGACDAEEDRRRVGAHRDAAWRLFTTGTKFPPRRGPEDDSLFHGSTNTGKLRDPRYWEALDDVDDKD